MVLAKNILKTFFFYVLLALYAIFIPFVFVKCSKVADEQYIVVDEEDPSADEQLAECQSQEFLTADCVELIQAEDARIAAEDSAIVAGLTAAEDALDCMTGKTTSSTVTVTATSTGTSTATTTTTQVIDCVDDEDAETLIAGYDACNDPDHQDTVDDNDECPDIDEDYDALVTDCQLSTTDIPDSFCDVLIDDFNDPSEDNVNVD